MNANELADELDEAADYLESEKIFAWHERAAANMLRQQADRIAKLEKAKTLTDEEILEIVRLGLDEFRAILRKAQE